VGVGEYWLLDPYKKRAEFYQRKPKAGLESVSPDAKGIYRSKAIPGFWINVSWLWKYPSPTLKTVRVAWDID
jgi:Uma2 family endonuclease